MSTKKETKFEFIKSIILAAIIAFLFRGFLFEPFYIPSGSMNPTLVEGDYIFVKKYSYGYSRYSFLGGLPIFKGRIFESKPKRGDVVVFRVPYDTNINYIKRVIGLPGDTVQMRKGSLYVNNKVVHIDYVKNTVVNIGDKDLEVLEYRETLPNGVAHHILDTSHSMPLDNTNVYKVPRGHYFMMGDNRDNSQDSRVLSVVGYVPFENIIGPARIIFMSFDKPIWKIWHWFDSFRKNRFLKSL